MMHDVQGVKRLTKSPRDIMALRYDVCTMLRRQGQLRRGISMNRKNLRCAVDTVYKVRKYNWE